MQAIDQYGPAASAEQIADLAGVSRTVLYRYFRDLEDLRQAIADHIVDARGRQRPAEPGAQPPEQPLARSSAARSRSIIGWLDEHPSLYFFLRGRQTGPSLDAVETTLADKVASLLKVFLLSFGIDSDEAEPGAYSIVGFVESTGAWWLATRTMSRERITDFVCTSVWHLIEGIAQRRQPRGRLRRPLGHLGARRDPE